MDLLKSFLPNTVFLVPLLYGFLVGLTIGVFAALRLRKAWVIIWTICGAIIGVYIGSGSGFFLFTILNPNADFFAVVDLIVFYLNTGMLVGSILGAEIAIIIFGRLRRLRN